MAVGRKDGESRVSLGREIPAHERPFVIAGPCVGESAELMDAVADHMAGLARELDFDLVFKASFDKANRTSNGSFRGAGLDRTLVWLDAIRGRLGVPVLTDIHESHQAAPAAEVCDWLQIPAFLCRQTDVIVAAVETGRFVNIKKGQFLAPETTAHIVEKVRAAAAAKGLKPKCALTERGTMFGYGNYVVDMRGFAVMARAGVPVIFDITHSTQRMSAGGSGGEVTGGDRDMGPLLTRSAIATGHVDGLFMEVHTDPARSRSDRDVILSLRQAEVMLRQAIPFWRHCRGLSAIDSAFK